MQEHHRPSCMQGQTLRLQSAHAVPEELNDLYCLPNIVPVIKSRIMRWAGHVARLGEKRDVYSVLVGKLRKRDHSGEPGIDGRIIL